MYGTSRFWSTFLQWRPLYDHDKQGLCTVSGSSQNKLKHRCFFLWSFAFNQSLLVAMDRTRKKNRNIVHLTDETTNIENTVSYPGEAQGGLGGGVRWGGKIHFFEWRFYCRCRRGCLSSSCFSCTRFALRAKCLFRLAWLIKRLLICRL